MSETQNTAVDPRQFNEDELVKRIADGKARLRELKAVQAAERKQQRAIQRGERDDLKDVHRQERQALADEIIKPYRDEREVRRAEMHAAAQGSPLPPPGN